MAAALRAMHASNRTDVHLLQRIAAHDTAALAELYDRHCRLLFGFILRIVRDRGEAEEILQEVFLRIWKRAETAGQVKTRIRVGMIAMRQRLEHAV